MFNPSGNLLSLRTIWIVAGSNAVDCMIHGEMATAKLDLSEFAAHGHMWVPFGPNHPEPSQQIANLVEPSTWELFFGLPVPRSRLVAAFGVFQMAPERRRDPSDGAMYTYDEAFTYYRSLRLGRYDGMIWIWVNYNKLTTSSLEIIVRLREIIPKWP